MFQILWQNPAALFALAAVAVPILIHILVQRRAEKLAFPTLRFLQPTRLAAIRRHLLDDAALLAVRAAILAAAVAAVAGPLLVTPARRQVWDRRVVRAVVTDEGTDVGPAPPAGQAPPLRIRTASLPDGIHRAVAWLKASAPARRELLVASNFPIGSITAADIAVIPPSIGIRLERAATLPAARTIDAGRVLAGNAVLARQLTLDGPRTIVRETAAAGVAAWPIEIVNAPAAQPAVDAAIAAVRAQRVWEPLPERRARVVIAGADPPAAGAPVAITSPETPWVADAIARLVRDGELQSAAARVDTALPDGRFASPPWLTVASNREGRPLAIAAESGARLLVNSAAPPTDLFTPLLLRAVANVIGAVPDLEHAEVVPIPDRWLLEWARPAATPAPPGPGALRREDADTDRRWLWLAALGLLAIETWMRRARSASDERREEAARVA